MHPQTKSWLRLWSVTERLQRVLNAAARIVSGRHNRGLSQLLHTDLHWLDVADRVLYKLAITVHRCPHNKSPKYLTDCCVAVSDIAGRQRLRSAHRRQLDVRTAISTNNTRPSGVLCHWTNHLEFASRRAEMKLRTLSGSH